MDRGSAPPLLSIFRSRQQAEILTLLLGNPEHEFTLPEIAERTGAPYPSVHREVERAEAAGLVRSTRIGNSRIVSADSEGPYYDGLSQVLTRAFGPPQVLAEELAPIKGIHEAYIFGSWAARYSGEAGKRPVKDIDLLVLGQPQHDPLYEAMSRAEKRLGREVQVTIREPGWLTDGTDSFHDTVALRPLVRVLPPLIRTDRPTSSS